MAPTEFDDIASTFEELRAVISREAALRKILDRLFTERNEDAIIAVRKAQTHLERVKLEESNMRAIVEQESAAASKITATATKAQKDDCDPASTPLVDENDLEMHIRPTSSKVSGPNEYVLDVERVASRHGLGVTSCYISGIHQLEPNEGLEAVQSHNGETTVSPTIHEVAPERTENHPQMTFAPKNKKKKKKKLPKLGISTGEHAVVENQVDGDDKRQEEPRRVTSETTEMAEKNTSEGSRQVAEAAEEQHRELERQLDEIDRRSVGHILAKQEMPVMEEGRLVQLERDRLATEEEAAVFAARQEVETEEEWVNKDFREIEKQHLVVTEGAVKQAVEHAAMVGIKQQRERIKAEICHLHQQTQKKVEERLEAQKATEEEQRKAHEESKRRGQDRKARKSKGKKGNRERRKGMKERIQRERREVEEMERWYWLEEERLDAERNEAENRKLLEQLEEESSVYEMDEEMIDEEEEEEEEAENVDYMLVEEAAEAGEFLATLLAQFLVFKNHREAMHQKYGRDFHF